MNEDVKKVVLFQIRRELMGFAKNELVYLKDILPEQDFSKRRSIILGEINDSIRSLTSLIEQI